MKTKVSTVKRHIPEGHRKVKFCTGEYRKGILGSVMESEFPVWAEIRYEKNPVFSGDSKYYRLYTYEKI
jgi:hypothetical protein